MRLIGLILDLLWDILVELLSGVVAAALISKRWDLSPRAARTMMRWASRIRYGHTTEHGDRAEELDGLIQQQPGELVKKPQVAAHFLLWAIASRARWAVRSAVGALGGAPQRRQAGDRRTVAVGPALLPDDVDPHGNGHGDAGRLLDGPDDPDDPSGSEAEREPAPPRHGWGLTALATCLSVTGIVAGLAGAALAVALSGPDVALAFQSGDQPEDTRTQPSCVQTACSLPLRYDTWDLAPASGVRAVYGTDGTHEVDTLSGHLAVPAGCGSRIAWRLTADGHVLARGTLDDGDSDGLTDVDVPARRTPDALVLTARRVDDGDCTARLQWRQPGFEAPGLLPAGV